MYRDPEEVAQNTEEPVVAEVAALPEAEPVAATGAGADEFAAAAGGNVAEWGAATEEFEPADSQF